MTDTIESLRAELAVETAKRWKAEAETARIRDLSLHFCDGPPDDPNVLLRRRIVERLRDIEREARALLANINDPRRQALDTRDLVAALEAK